MLRRKGGHKNDGPSELLRQKSAASFAPCQEEEMFAGLISFVLAALSFVQVPQWDNDWTKCSVAVPDTACHWYVVNPDNTFGKGFSWITAPKLDVEALQDVAIQHEFTVQSGYQTTVELMDATSETKYGDDY